MTQAATPQSTRSRSRAIQLPLEGQGSCSLERRHQGRTRGRSTESKPAAVSSSGTSTGGLTS